MEYLRMSWRAWWDIEAFQMSHFYFTIFLYKVFHYSDAQHLCWRVILVYLKCTSHVSLTHLLTEMIGWLFSRPIARYGNFDECPFKLTFPIWFRRFLCLGADASISKNGVQFWILPSNTFVHRLENANLIESNEECSRDRFYKNFILQFFFSLAVL